MTEAEWAVCQDPVKMLEYLHGRASDRKLRLFACACCRREWDLITIPALKQVVETAELGVDRPMTQDEWVETFRSVPRPRDAFRSIQTFYVEAFVAHPDAWYAAHSVSQDWLALARKKDLPLQVRQRLEPAAQCGLFRCIVGNPFKPLSILPTVLATQGGVVVNMATAIYNDRRWEDMPLLGDALEEAGCDDQAVLDHCRGPGAHARGCFVVDAILNRS